MRPRRRLASPARRLIGPRAIAMLAVLVLALTPAVAAASSSLTLFVEARPFH